MMEHISEGVIKDTTFLTPSHNKIFFIHIKGLKYENHDGVDWKFNILSVYDESTLTMEAVTQPADVSMEADQEFVNSQSQVPALPSTKSSNEDCVPTSTTASK